MSNTGDLVSRIYGNFRGVDFRGEEINIMRSPDCLNVWKDYKETESIRTRPAMKLHTEVPYIVHGIFFYKDMMLVHYGAVLAKYVNGESEILHTNLNKASGQAFVYNDIWYFKDGKHYLQYDGTTLQEVVGYVPTTSIGRKPSGGGTIYEDVNMLSEYRINTFLGDGESKVFYLDAQNLDEDCFPEVWINDVEAGITPNASDRYVWDCKTGKIEFVLQAPPKPLTDGQDNVKVKFKKTVSGYRERILKCTMLQVFDNRVFFSGNPDYPNKVWHCSLNDPSYVSDLDEYPEGMDEAAVKGMVAGNNALWVFREPSDSNTNVFYHTPAIDDEYGKIYPSTHSSITIGCIGKATNFNDDIVFFSERGMEGISGDVTTEQVAAHRSSLVDRKLIAEADYANMVLAEWEGYLFVIIGKNVYLADSRTAFTNENHIEYDWFYWEMERSIYCATVHDNVLYLGTYQGIYTLNDYGKDIKSYWVTPKDKFKYPQMQKTTNKKSCTVEATGKEISVYAKTNKDEDFILLDTFTDVKDAFSCRVKKKKFKDLQLKFYSPKRFSLETATLECFIGGYLKNL